MTSIHLEKPLESRIMTKLLPTLMGLLCYIAIYAQPANDVCNTAIELEVNATCTPLSFSNINASDSGEMPMPACGNYAGADIWFSVVMPVSGHLAIDARSNSPKPALALYRGNCGALDIIECNDRAPDDTDSRLIIHNENLAGSTLYLRVFPKNTADFTDFGICAYEPDIPDSDRCRDAVVLPVPNQIGNFVNYNGKYATGNSIYGAPGCGATEDFFHDLWFRLTVPTSGAVTVNTDVDNKPVISIYEGDCDNLTLSSCSHTSGGTLVEYNEPSNAGNDIYIRIMLFDSKFNNDFRLRVFESNAPLPVELTYFEAMQRDEKNVLLRWGTASELNNSHFEIQHSHDGEYYQSLKVVDGNGTTTEAQSYSYIHQNAVLGINYYRIRQVDFDGTFEYSPVEVVDFDGERLIKVYPTPSTGKFTLEVSPTLLDEDDPFTVTIHNNVGTVVLEQKMELTLAEIELPHVLPAGYYWVSISNRIKNMGTMLLIQRD